MLKIKFRGDCNYLTHFTNTGRTEVSLDDNNNQLCLSISHHKNELLQTVHKNFYIQGGQYFITKLYPRMEDTYSILVIQ